MTNHENHKVLIILRSLVDSSEKKYLSGDYKGAIEDRIIIESLIDKESNIKEIKNELSIYIKDIRKKKSKYDLIRDFKEHLKEKRKSEIIEELELRSKEKYILGDFKGAIRAIRRAEQYY